MAKRFDDEEDNEVPVERKRRRPKKKPVDDDDDGGGPSARKGGADEDDEDEDSISTGNVLLDIILDFRDDCIDWAKAHFAVALALGIFFFLFSLTSVGLTVRYIINYMNRPTVVKTLLAYDLGSYGEAKALADGLLLHAKEDDADTRSVALFVLGAATCSIAEIAWDSNRQPYYLAAANYLSDAEALGFPRDRRAEGYFLLGKSLYLSGELVRCRAPLQKALELEAPESKMIDWYLANSWFLDTKPDPAEALRYVRLFQRNPLVTEEERHEADLLQSMILLQLDQVAAAEKVFLRVPLFNRYETMRYFVSGQIAFYKARELRREAIELENSRNPVSHEATPTAPAPVEPDQTIPGDTTPPLPPTSPMENPETEKLLPTPPESSVWPVFPSAPNESPAKPQDPWAVLPPAPVTESYAQGEALFRRMASMAGQVHPPVAQEVRHNISHTEKEAAKETSAEAPKDEKESPKDVSTATSPAPEPPRLESEKPKVEPKPADPNAVIVLPTETHKMDATTAPLPMELPLGVRTMPSDPRLIQAEALHHQANEKYKEAIVSFQHVQHRDSFLPRWIRAAMLLEGISYEEMGEPAQAQTIYLRINETYPTSSEAAAANFLWAEIERGYGRMETALAGYARTFDLLRNEANYSCPWLSKEAMLRRCDEILYANMTLKEYKPSLTLLSLLRDVMPEADLSRHRGELYEQWAADLAQRAARTLGDEGEELNKQLREKYRRAGDAFAEYARSRFGHDDYDRVLWRAAENIRLGRDYRKAIPFYRQYLHVNWKDRQAEALYYLGEMYLHLDGLDEAVEVLERALQDYPNHSLVPRIRLVLSRVYHEKDEWAKAVALLQKNLVGDYTPSSAIYRDSVFALGKLYYDHGNMIEAIPYLEDALQNYPDAVQTADAHYCLSQAYLDRAARTSGTLVEVALDEVRRPIEAAILADRQNALIHLQKSEEQLTRRQEAVGLTEAERLMLRNTLFGIGALLMQLERYEQAIPVYDIAATRYQSQVSALDALMQIAVAFRRLDRPDDALSTLNRAKVLLSQLEKSGTIPPDNNWNSIIDVQKNLILLPR